MEKLKVVGSPEFKIEKGIPNPPSPGRRKIFPFGEMEVGDSFFVSAAMHARVASAGCWYGTRNDKKFSLRRERDGYRCWRTA